MKYSALAALLCAMFLAVPALPAHAQATRTWVSGVGDDVNPCSRTAPCKTFAGAISKTAVNGSINCLDPAGYGGVTITKSTTINCEGTIGGVLVAGTFGITVTGAGVVANLRGLDIEGVGTGTVGINVINGASAYVRKTVVRGFKGGSAIGINLSGGGTLVVDDSAIHGNGTGIVLNGSGGAVDMVLQDVAIHGNSSHGVSVSSAGARARAMVGSSTIAFNGGTGFNVTGGGTFGMIGSSSVFGNAIGVALSGGKLYSYKNNHIAGNTVDGTPLLAYPNARATHDFNGDAMSDMTWRRNDGLLGMWLMNGLQISSAPGFGVVPTNWSIVGQRDFNGDGLHDWLWRNTADGTVGMWLLNGANILQQVAFDPPVPISWIVAGTGDFNGDGKGDILWRHTGTGEVAIWFMDGLAISAAINLGIVPTTWTIVETGDFNGDGKRDIVWRLNDGQVGIWLMDGAAMTQNTNYGIVPTNWIVAATGDFDGNGKSDILWRDTTTGEVGFWFMDGATLLQVINIGIVPTTWTIAETGDFDGDGKSDILWRNNTGEVGIWFMNGAQLVSNNTVGGGPIGAEWSIVATNAN